jgi:hypothetical protein
MHLHTSCVSVNVKKSCVTLNHLHLHRLFMPYIWLYSLTHNTGWAISCLLGVVCRVMAKEAGLLWAWNVKNQRIYGSEFLKIFSIS